jgi:hypothetical protein
MSKNCTKKCRMHCTSQPFWANLPNKEYERKCHKSQLTFLAVCITFAAAKSYALRIWYDTVVEKMKWTLELNSTRPEQFTHINKIRKLKYKHANIVNFVHKASIEQQYLKQHHMTTDVTVIIIPDYSWDEQLGSGVNVSGARRNVALLVIIDVR